MTAPDQPATPPGEPVGEPIMQMAARLLSEAVSEVLALEARDPAAVTPQLRIDLAAAAAAFGHACAATDSTNLALMQIQLMQQAAPARGLVVPGNVQL